MEKVNNTMLVVGLVWPKDLICRFHYRANYTEQVINVSLETDLDLDLLCADRNLQHADSILLVFNLNENSCQAKYKYNRYSIKIDRLIFLCTVVGFYAVTS